jgi:D-amino peptidase
MKIYIMTDLEGVAGVLDFENWCTPESRYYDAAKELLTLEVNAAVEGFIEGGATEIIVADGHGCGGLDSGLLSPRAMLMRGGPEGYPLGLDTSFEAIAWIGQHAKAGTEYAHLAHTGSFPVLDYTINGISVGEFGQVALCAAELGVRPIFASGDLAFTKEAEALFPGIETVAVKHGTTPGRGDTCTAEEYGSRNRAAVHYSPERAREMIYQGAQDAMNRARGAGHVQVDMQPPYEATAKYRASADKSAREATFRHPSSISELINISHGIKPPKP